MGLVCRQNLLHGLQLNNDFVAHYKVDPVTAIEFYALISNRNLDLLAKRKIANAEFVT